jgi:hypothetical protein
MLMRVITSIGFDCWRTCLSSLLSSTRTALGGHQLGAIDRVAVDARRVGCGLALLGGKSMARRMCCERMRDYEIAEALTG